jgi:hypothetical protein
MDTNKTENSNLVEGVKLLYDYMKHLATLSTGSIVVLATFLSRFGSAHWKKMAVIAVVCFVLSIIGNAIAAGVYAMKAETGDFSYIKGATATIAAVPFLISIVCFVLAMIALATFTIGNLL